MVVYQFGLHCTPYLLILSHITHISVLRLNTWWLYTFLLRAYVSSFSIKLYTLRGRSPGSIAFVEIPHSVIKVLPNGHLTNVRNGTSRLPFAFWQVCTRQVIP